MSDVGTYPVDLHGPRPVSQRRSPTVTSGTLDPLGGRASTRPVSTRPPTGSATSFYENTAGSYTVECEAQSGVSGHDGLPELDRHCQRLAAGRRQPGLRHPPPRAAQPAPTGTSGSGTTEEYILECALTDTPTSYGAEDYPLTFTATGAGREG